MWCVYLDTKDWTYVTAIVILALVTILGVFDKLSPEDMMKIFLLVIGIVLGGTAMYAVGRNVGFKEGSGNIG